MNNDMMAATKKSEMNNLMAMRAAIFDDNSGIG